MIVTGRPDDLEEKDWKGWDLAMQAMIRAQREDRRALAAGEEAPKTTIDALEAAQYAARNCIKEHGMKTVYELVTFALDALKSRPLTADRSSSMGDEWQPIATAPKDGTWIIGYRPRSFDGEPDYLHMHWYVSATPELCEWQGYEWAIPHWSDQPTHWMPLPNPPALVDHTGGVKETSEAGRQG